MEIGEQAHVDPELVSSSAVKAYRDTLKQQLAEGVGSRDKNTVVIKHAHESSSVKPLQVPNRVTKGFFPPQEPQVGAR